MGLWQSEKESDRQGFVGLWESSDKLNPVIKIPLITSANTAIGNVSPTFTRNSTATYVDDDGIEHTVAINVPLFRNGRYLPQTLATNIFLQSGTPATKAITVVSGSKYTVSCYGSGSIALSGAGSGTVVQGTPVTFTAASTTLTCVPISVNKAQVELGSQATSYIPTTIAPMTRAADVLHYDVNSVITQGQGSLYCEFVNGVVTGVTRRVLNISDNTANNRLTIYIDTDGNISFFCNNEGVTQISYGAFTILPELNKVLFIYENNSAKFYLNGSLLYTDTVCTIPTNFTKLNVGCLHSGSGQLNSEIGNVKYFKEVLTPAEAIKITTL